MSDEYENEFKSLIKYYDKEVKTNEVKCYRFLAEKGQVMIVFFIDTQMIRIYENC